MGLSLHKILTILLSVIWFVNGLFCKILNLVPRHEQIVSSILGIDDARMLTIAIGVSEVLMAVWILTGLFSRLNAIAQILIIAVMNILEYMLVPELLLWGRFNIVFAFLMIVVIYINEFHLKKVPAY